jgi:Rieske Fe-S protein
MTPDSNPPTEPLPGRRTFLDWLMYGLGTIAAAAVGLPFVGYLLGAKKAPVDWFPLGLVEDFPLNQTRRVTFTSPIRQPWDGMVANTGVYVRFEGRDDKTNPSLGYRFLIFAANCAHLGCPVEWFQESGLFLCPCHGGAYYANGERASGPPPRGLFRCVYRVRRVRGLNVLEVQAPHYPTLQDTLSEKA